MAALEHIVVVGGGLAGLRAVEAARAEGFGGRLTLVAAESHLPYDRPPLSKAVLGGERSADSVALVTEEQLKALEVDLLLGRPAHELDLGERRLLAGDAELRFDGLIAATGASPRQLPHLVGIENVFTLRTIDDSLAIGERLREAQHVTVVGAGFIGSEVAATARAAGVAVTVIELDTAPLARVVGPEIGHALMKLHADNGTEVLLGVTINHVETHGGRLTARLTDGRELTTDAIVVGIGVVPNAGWLESSGLELENGVVCDATLNVGVDGVFAVGDVANWPNPLFDRRMRVEHWTNAAQQGAHAARNLVHGERLPFEGSNYVWSDQYGQRVQFVGLTAGDPIPVAGAIGEDTFAVCYREADHIVGAAAVGYARLLIKSRMLIEGRTAWDDALVELSV
jgi:NADPH-dependent 2,4-dienoyl-CoA reductase/sulfur reductase-like enzyme